jgi:ketosteroid isomerase-like protein
MNDDAALAIRFNDCINAGDLDGLEGLMTADHTFTDTGGTAFRGKDACMEAWRGFFQAYPGYRNIFSTFATSGEAVTMAGKSQCPGHPELEGPALWSAVARGGRVAEWHVYEDTAVTRRALGL